MLLLQGVSANELRRIAVGPDGTTPAVLLAEDEVLIGLDLSDTLESAGYRVIGPVATVASALSFLQNDPPQLALIDVRLQDGSCKEVIRQLRLRQVPFMVYSGNQADEAFAAEFGDVPWLAKPASPRDVIASLEKLRAQMASPC